MVVNAIEKVTGSEAQAKQLRDSAAAECKQKLLVARREARQVLEQSAAQAEGEARGMMQNAEERAAQTTAVVLEQARQECEQLKQDARTRLDAAAQLIVERVVNR